MGVGPEAEISAEPGVGDDKVPTVLDERAEEAMGVIGERKGLGLGLSETQRRAEEEGDFFV